ncbi:MAG: 3-hydroxyacyl-CoA dehydrogenase NAD-binding domain-containing protein [Nocardioides sp.]|uniref:3-hydroxyacyl-CoA dehydrogenase NAD-binding domain-containing protein n=1 Tax=Nocardioides sp. TaxID=35761 RepID=UPI0039E5F999
MTTAPVRLSVEDGIARILLDDPAQSANTMNRGYAEAMASVVDELRSRIEADPAAIDGVVVSSAKRTFFAGGDLREIIAVTREAAEEEFAHIEAVKRPLRLLETCGRPVVAAINGAALGGGLEIALAAHHRIAAEGRYDIGLPEAGLGLLPGGGGVARTVRMLGVQEALLQVLLQGQRLSPEKARDVGLVDEVVPAEELLVAAERWIREHQGYADAATQPWDRRGYRMPGGLPTSPALAANLPAIPATVRKQLKGAPYRAPRTIVAAAVEGAYVDVDTALRIESRYFLDLAAGQQSKNMIQALFFDLNAINGGQSRPKDVPPTSASKVAVLGAGMMGAGIAYAAARAGLEVVLKDVSVEAAERGKGYSVALLDKQVARGRLAPEKRDEILARIAPTADYADLVDSDFVVEAVFESVRLKHEVFAEVEKVVRPDALLGSNTSTLPITELAAGVTRPEDFIGIHFFSPVDKMPLVEIIVGERTSDEALARVVDFVRQIKKTPIVVNDSRGFYTSRIFGTFVNEGVAMLGEGVNPYSIERATNQAGYPAPVLQLVDELNMELMIKVRDESKAAAEAAGRAWRPHPAEAVFEAMVGAGRPGRARGAGFYDYVDGKRGDFWAELGDRYPVASTQPAIADLRDRLTFVMSLESVKCLEEGVIRSVPDANVGSILGLGFPALLGGTLQHVNGYEAADGSIGVAAFVRRAQELAERYGDRFAPPASLVERAKSGELFV